MATVITTNGIIIGTAIHAQSTSASSTLVPTVASGSYALVQVCISTSTSTTVIIGNAGSGYKNAIIHSSGVLNVQNIIVGPGDDLEYTGLTGTIAVTGILFSNIS